MALTSLLESRSANIDFFLKLIGYQIHRIRIRLHTGFLSIAFSLAIVTGVEVGETVTSF